MLCPRWARQKAFGATPLCPLDLQRRNALGRIDAQFRRETSDRFGLGLLAQMTVVFTALLVGQGSAPAERQA